VRLRISKKFWWGHLTNSNEKYLDFPLTLLLSPRDCVVIMEEERFGRDRQSDSSALECGHLELSLTDLLGNTILSWCCSSVAY
jgi:hypothetical protein